METPPDFEPTGMDRGAYLDLMEIALEGWASGHELPENEGRESGAGGAAEKKKSDWEPSIAAGFERSDLQVRSRVLSCLGGLIANGRRTELGYLWARMMDEACEEAVRQQGDLTADFAVKELMTAFLAMKPFSGEAARNRWRELLGRIDPSVQYACTLDQEPNEEKLHNINVYNMVGEQLRAAEGLTRPEAYFARHWPVQLRRFDANGMYADPGAPMLYDLTVRAQIGLMLNAGYEGPFRAELDDRLRAGGLTSLFMQSASGQIPYGGRSAQFNFGEALHAAVCEYEASRYARLGELRAAGAFKRSARLAIRSIGRWLRPEDGSLPRHLKNAYPPLAEYGAEPYGYYGKYMITLGSFAYLAWLAADDTIAEEACPAEIGGYALRTSELFGQVFANAAGRSIQLDLRGSRGYDPVGLGRYHRRGMPEELSLSVPCVRDPAYRLPEGAASADVCIGPGWTSAGGSRRSLAEISDGLDIEVEALREAPEGIELRIVYGGPALTGVGRIEERYALSERGLEICCRLLPEAEAGADSAEPRPDKSEAAVGAAALDYRVPLLADNGAGRSEIDIEAGRACVRVGAYRYRVETDGIASSDAAEEYGNRSGVYRVVRFAARGQEIRLKLDVENS